MDPNSLSASTKVGDVVNIPAKIINIIPGESGKLTFVLQRLHPATSAQGGTQGNGENGFAVMWGT